MTPLFFTLENNHSLKIIPETRVYIDGRPILSYNYSVFHDENNGVGKDKGHTGKIIDPDYLGFITFEKPGHIFTYTAGDGRTLSPGEAEEVIEYISLIRDNPSIW